MSAAVAGQAKYDKRGPAPLWKLLTVADPGNSLCEAMSEIREPEPVKLFVGMIVRPGFLDAAREAVCARFERADVQSPEIPFDFTDYYQKQMGTGLTRAFFGFDKLVDPGELARIKTTTNEMEDRFQDAHVARPVNLDPGYITEGGVVLASTKASGHRIYIGAGIYAELTLMYERGGFAALPWTYPDFRTESYHGFFLDLRRRYRSQIVDFRNSTP